MKTDKESNIVVEGPNPIQKQLLHFFAGKTGVSSHKKHRFIT